MMLKYGNSPVYPLAQSVCLICKAKATRSLLLILLLVAQDTLMRVVVVAEACMVRL
jgi:hypothetical protein